jgi:hypothetical protein
MTRWTAIAPGVAICLALLASGCTSSPPPGIDITPAPIHEVTVAFLESQPVQVSVHIKGGLRDTCTKFHEIKTSRSGTQVNISVTVERQRDAICGQVYTFFEKNVNLGSDFTSGKTYTLKVNDNVSTFTMP